MKKLISSAVLALVLLPLAASMPQAGPISSACIRSDRDAASRRLCNCIQSVANQKLSRTDQKVAASFFKDPHKAQEMRQSDRRGHERFWLRYKAFGQTASATCSRQS